MWMAILNPEITNKYSEKCKKILKTNRILKLKYKPSGGQSFTFTIAGRRGQFAPPAAGKPKHRKNFYWLFARSGKNFGDTCHQKLFLSLLHSIGIQLIPVEFWLRPHQWCQSCRSSAPPLSSVNVVNDGSMPIKYMRRCPPDLRYL